MGLYTYTKELFPTTLRTTALGTASATARVGVLSSPFIAMLDSISPVLPLIVYGIFVLAAAIFSLWLWPETNKKPMTETLEEAERVALTQNPWVKCCSSK
jgi:nucleoside recognition membrane protein YjiH